MIGGPGLTKGLGCYLFGDGPDAVLYNCSIKSDEEWAKAGQQHIALGFYFLLSGIGFEMVHMLAASVMYLKGLTAIPCYRIMFVLAFYEMLCVFTSSIVPGINYFRGDVYCTNPKFGFFFGTLTIGLYCGCCWCILLLAFNRLAVMLEIGFLIRLFDNKRSLDILLSVSLLYSSFIVLFTTPIPFNTKAMTYFFDPLIYDSSYHYDYSNAFHSFNNSTTCALILIIYGTISVFAFCSTRDFSSTATKIFQRQVFIQSAIICLLNATSEVLYVSIQQPAIYALFPNSIVVLAHILWQWGMAASAFINCLLNKTIRTTIIGFIKTGHIYKINDIHTKSAQDSTTAMSVIQRSRLPSIS